MGWVGGRPTDRTRPISGTGPVPGATSHANGLDFPLPGQGIYRRTPISANGCRSEASNHWPSLAPVGSSFPSQRPFCLLGERGHDGRTTTEPPRVGPTGATPTPNRTAPLPLRTGPYADRFLSWPPVMFRDGGIGSVHPDIPANPRMPLHPDIRGHSVGEPIMLWDRRAEPLVAYGECVQAVDGLR